MESGGLPFLHCHAWELDTTGCPVSDPVFFRTLGVKSQPMFTVQVPL